MTRRQTLHITKNIDVRSRIIDIIFNYMHDIKFPHWRGTYNYLRQFGETRRELYFSEAVHGGVTWLSFVFKPTPMILEILQDLKLQNYLINYVRRISISQLEILLDVRPQSSKKRPKKEKTEGPNKRLHKSE